MNAWSAITSWVNPLTTKAKFLKTRRNAYSATARILFHGMDYAPNVEIRWIASASVFGTNSISKWNQKKNGLSFAVFLQIIVLELM